MIERDYVNKIQDWLKKSFPGCYIIKLESPSTAGILDLYFAYGGKSIWFECKHPRYRNKNWRNKMIQEWHQRQLLKNGITAHFVYSLDDVKKIMAPLMVISYPCPLQKS